MILSGTAMSTIAGKLVSFNQRNSCSVAGDDNSVIITAGNCTAYDRWVGISLNDYSIASSTVLDCHSIESAASAVGVTDTVRRT